MVFLGVVAISDERSTPVQHNNSTDGTELPCLIIRKPQVAQRDAGVLILRWNGHTFLGELSDLTLPKDLAAGQAIPSPHPRALLHVRIPTGLDRQAPVVDYLLVGAAVADARVLAGEASLVEALDGPVSLALSPDGKTLYVACAHSRAVVGFSRDAASGLLSYDSSRSVTPTPQTLNPEP